MIRASSMAAALIAAFVAAAATRGPSVILHFRVFAATGIPLTDVLWTGHEFLYVENTTNKLWAAPAAGLPVRLVASMPQQTEETRCRLSPGTHGWPTSAVFCHAPTNTIYRIDLSGASVAVFARLPERTVSDGALAFDTSGGFGFRLLAATGRSGAGQAGGGSVYAIGPTGTVSRLGAYHGPGGADEALVAPPGFGSAGSALLLAVDAGPGGRLVAFDRHGRSTTVATLPDGPNPIATLAPTEPRRGAAQAGLYVTDTASHNLYRAPAADFARYRGAVVVGSELQGRFWVVRAQGPAFDLVPLRTSLRGKHYNLEGATYLAP
jgi:hypothetical protein